MASRKIPIWVIFGAKIVKNDILFFMQCSKFSLDDLEYAIHQSCHSKWSKLQSDWHWFMKIWPIKLPKITQNGPKLTSDNMAVIWTNVHEWKWKLGALHEK